MSKTSSQGEYALATGEAAARRLHILHACYSPVGRRVLTQAGLRQGMTIADFGCGVGATTSMLAEMTGPTGRVVGIDVSGPQLQQARKWCAHQGQTNVTFREASAYSTGLPRNSFDLVYCRFLLLHLTDPIAALREMRDVLKPGGILVIEDGNLMSAGSHPPSSLDTFGDLWGRLGPLRNLNYGLADNLFHLVKEEGFPDPQIEIHQPAFARGENKLMLKLSVEEMGPSCISAGLLSSDEFDSAIQAMDRDTANPEILALMPKMSLVWARKPVE